MDPFKLNGFGPYKFEGEILTKRARAVETFICLATEHVVEISNGSVMQMVHVKDEAS